MVIEYQTHNFPYKEVVYKKGSVWLLKMLRKFSAGFLKPKKVDKLTFEIHIFMLAYHIFCLICIDLLQKSLYFSLMFVYCLSICVAL